MKYFLFLFLLLSACSRNTKRVEEILKADGYTDINVGGYAIFSCGIDWVSTNSFKATKNSMQVSGAVCSSFSKGSTIRIVRVRPIPQTPEDRIIDSLIEVRKTLLRDSLKKHDNR